MVSFIILLMAHTARIACPDRQTDRQTDRQNDKTITVTLAAHARRGLISFLTKGCSCKKGCQANQCGCRKKGNRCGPGCQCQGCRNAGIANTCTDENLSESETESEDNSSSDEECITTEIVMDFDEIIYSATNITDT